MTELDSSSDFMLQIHKRIVELLARGERGVLASVIGVSGSSPGRRSMKLLLCRDGSVVGTVGGGRMEGEVLRAAREVMEEGLPRRLDLSLNAKRPDNVGICGGQIEVYVEPIAMHTIYLFGSGHVSHAVCRVASLAGFRVVVLDDRPELTTPERFPDAAEIHVGPFEEIFRQVQPGPFSYLCLITRGFATDQEILALAVRESYRYVGMIGSQSKIHTVFENLEKRGVTRTALERVHAPIGIEIGAETPGEIGVCVVAELIREKNRGGPSPGAEAPR